jgi:TPR repeat protein
MKTERKFFASFLQKRRVLFFAKKKQKTFAHVLQPTPDMGALRAMSACELTRLLSGNPDTAAQWVALAARHGNSAAQVRFGRMLLEGTGVSRDADAAFRWFATAARDGDVEAMNMRGRCHENGWGTPAGMPQAAHWYGRAAARGDAWAQYNLGHLLLDGNGIARDHAAAFAAYRRAAAQGHARAMNLVGRCHEEGWGTERDAAAAAAAYRASAEAGYFRGQYNYATLLLAAGRAEAARTWLRRAATDGPPEFSARVAALLARMACRAAA